MIVEIDKLERVGSCMEVQRRTLGLTQKDVADAAGMVKQTVSAIEAGDKIPRLGTLAAMADALGLEIVIRRKKS